MVASMESGQGQQLGDLSCAKVVVAQSAKRKEQAVATFISQSPRKCGYYRIKQARSVTRSVSEMYELLRALKAARCLPEGRVLDAQT